MQENYENKIFEVLEKEGLIFCQVCKTIIKLNLDLKSLKLNNPGNKKNIQINLPSKEVLQKLNNNYTSLNKHCFLCFNIFDISNNKYSLLISQIKKNIIEYEHSIIKLIFKFSCIFNFIFWFINTKIEKIYKKNFNYIFQSDTLRQVFNNNTYINFFSEKLEEKIDNEGYTRDLEIIFNYDFDDIIYQKFNEIILNSLKNDKNKINLLLNKKAGRALIKSITEENNCDIDILYSKLNLFFNTENIIENLSINYIISPLPLYLSGNYIKLSREIGQTHFDRIFNISSVDEEIKKILCKNFLNSENDFTFTAGGREDRDVRMLGKGRSFVYEILNSKKINFNLNEINNEFNNKSLMVKINNLQKKNKSIYSIIKKDENSKIKIYVAIVYTSKKIEKNEINNIKNLEIKQITPIRVLHQRALKERNKQIYEIKEIERINDHFIIIEIQSSAGTYIKEFINGDCGRTMPNLGSILGCECDILQLDVKDIIY